MITAAAEEEAAKDNGIEHLQEISNRKELFRNEDRYSRPCLGLSMSVTSSLAVLLHILVGFFSERIFVIEFFLRNQGLNYCLIFCLVCGLEMLYMFCTHGVLIKTCVVCARACQAA